MAGRYNNHPGQGNDPVSSLILVILAIFFPPAVPLILSGCGADFCINLLLTILAFFPGCIHALYLIYKQAQVNERAGYVYAGQAQPAHPGHPHQHQPQQHQPSYGATSAPPPPGPGYATGREPWEGQQQQQQAYAAQAPPPSYVKK